MLPSCYFPNSPAIKLNQHMKIVNIPLTQQSHNVLKTIPPTRSPRLQISPTSFTVPVLGSLPELAKCQGSEWRYPGLCILTPEGIKCRSHSVGPHQTKSSSVAHQQDKDSGEVTGQGQAYLSTKQTQIGE